ncbi:MAG TPA: hypothetical protein VFZ87_03785, partial [Gemmatimonadales bacterium]
MCGFVLVALAGCAPKSTPSPILPPAADPCLLGSPSAEPLDTFTIALTEPLDLNHARPTNDSERLAFRNLRADLVTVDCQGNLRPGVVQ